VIEPSAWARWKGILIENIVKTTTTTTTTLDVLHDHTKLRFGALKVYFLPNGRFFLLHIKYPIDGHLCDPKIPKF
jgi:hypothetical protein